jgi:hypothetical protein
LFQFNGDSLEWANVSKVELGQVDSSIKKDGKRADNFKTWHKILGHINNKDLIALSKRDVEIDQIQQSNDICDPCQKGKQSRKTFSNLKGSRDRSLRKQLQDNERIDNSGKRQRLRLNIERTSKEPDRKTFGLQLVKRGPGTSSGPRKAKNRALWRRRPPPENPDIVEESTTSKSEKEAGQGVRAGNMGAPATPRITAPLLHVKEREGIFKY